MKKCLIIILSLSIISCFVGCSDNQNSTTKNSDSSVASVQNTSGASDTVVVPNVVGKDVAEATKELEKLELAVELVSKNQLLLKDEFKKYNIGEIYEQSIKAGTMCKKNTNLILYYVSDEPEFEYITNADNTICLVLLSVYSAESKTITIPSNYDNFKVAEINLTNIQLGADYTLKIPKNIRITGDTNCKIEII